MKINDIIKLISLSNKIELIGSNALNVLKYSTDYDLQELVRKRKNNNSYLLQFQNIFKVVKETPNVYITDFKAGTLNTYPVRWSYDDIMRGFKQIDTITIKFINTLHNNENKVKIDLIALIDGIFTEFSCNYYFSSNENEIDAELPLLLDVKNYYHVKKFMKMLKRITSYRIYREENIDDLIKFFNSDAGLFYQIVHKITVVLDLMTLVSDVDKTIVLQSVKKINIPSNYEKYVQNINVKNMTDKLNTLKGVLNNDLNDLVINFINN